MPHINRNNIVVASFLCYKHYSTGPKLRMTFWKVETIFFLTGSRAKDVILSAQMRNYS